MSIQPDFRTPAAASGFYKPLLAIALVALSLRLALRAITGTELFWVDGYTFFAELADSLAAGQGYRLPGGEPTAFRVPLYPIFIALVTGGSRATWLLLTAQALVSVGTLVCGALIARRLFGNEAGLITAALCAIYPYYVWHDLGLQETSLFTFLAVLGTLLLFVTAERRSWIVCLATGAVLGLAILTRTTLLPFAAFAILWLCLPDQRGNSLRVRLASAALACAALLLCLSPWLIRAKELTGAYGLGTEFGAAVYAGNHKLTFAYYPEGSIDESRALMFSSLSAEERKELKPMAHDEVALSEWFLAKGLKNILADPVAFLNGALKKVWAAFGPLPSPRKSLPVTIAYVASWLPVFLLGLAGLWQDRRNWRRDLVFYAHIVSFAGISGVLWAHTSHRSYLDIYFMIFAAGFIVFALRRVGFRGPARSRFTA